MTFLKAVAKGAAVLVVMILLTPISVPAVLATMGGDHRLLQWLMDRTPRLTPSGPTRNTDDPL